MFRHFARTDSKKSFTSERVAGDFLTRHLLKLKKREKVQEEQEEQEVSIVLLLLSSQTSVMSEAMFCSAKKKGETYQDKTRKQSKAKGKKKRSINRDFPDDNELQVRMKNERDERRGRG